MLWIGACRELRSFHFRAFWFLRVKTMFPIFLRAFLRECANYTCVFKLYNVVVICFIVRISVLVYFRGPNFFSCWFLVSSCLFFWSLARKSASPASFESVRCISTCFLLASQGASQGASRGASQGASRGTYRRLPQSRSLWRKLALTDSQGRAS